LVRKKTKVTKKQIKEDTFVTSTLKAWEYIKEHENQFFIAVLALIVIVAGIGWYIHSKAVEEKKAISQFSEGLFAFQRGDLKSAEEFFKVTVERYSGTREGAYAQYLIGKIALESGRNTDAITAFEKYINQKSKRFPFYRDSALEGIAIAYENERQYNKAADTYMRLLKELRNNKFLESYYMRRAVDNLKVSGRNKEAVDILEKLLEKSEGIDKRNIEIEISILKSRMEEKG